MNYSSSESSEYQYTYGSSEWHHHLLYIGLLKLKCYVNQFCVGLLSLKHPVDLLQWLVSFQDTRYGTGGQSGNETIQWSNMQPLFSGVLKGAFQRTHAHHCRHYYSHCGGYNSHWEVRRWTGPEHTTLRQKWRLVSHAFSVISLSIYMLSIVYICTSTTVRSYPSSYPWELSRAVVECSQVEPW